jgi:integrase
MAERLDVPAQPIVAGVDLLSRSEALVADLPAAFTGSVFDPRNPALSGVFMAGSQTTVLRIDGLPELMQREIRWWLATCERTGKRQIHASEWNRWTATAAAVLERRPAVCSFGDLSLSEWMTAWSRVFHAERGQIAAARSRDRAEIALRAMLRQLAVVYSDRAWWQHDVWSLQLDTRIPRREHEPRANTATRWASITPDWLREGVKFYLHLGLESGYLSWSSVNPQHSFFARFGAFVLEQELDHPALVDDPAELRSVALTFGTFLHAWRRERVGRSARGGGLNAHTIRCTQHAIARFYRVMSDYRLEAADALGDRRWAALSDTHARLYRPEDLPRERVLRQADERNYITDTDLANMLAYVELLGVARDQTMSVNRDGEQIGLAGSGHPAIMRAWLIQALTGRRASEVLMMDFDPLIALPGIDPDSAPDGAMVARLRYQQTKIDAAPNTILVGNDVVQIVREQQAWVREQWKLDPTGSVRYLFPKTSGNRHGQSFWETTTYDRVLKDFSHRLGLRDHAGNLLLYSRSHRLRHTKATTLLNAGAPIHVVQRYLGHRSPEMTMRYAATLAETAEREFLAAVKIGRDGREIGVDRRDLLDLLQLDRRTDRILPNGYCLLPPTRSCDKGNACHGCDHFATDHTHLPEIRRQLTETQRLIEHRQTQHAARYGEPMSERNIWLEQRLSEVRSMQLEITALQAMPDTADSAIRGPGVLGRPGYQPGPVRVQLTPPPTRDTT